MSRKLAAVVAQHLVNLLVHQHRGDRQLAGRELLGHRHQVRLHPDLIALREKLIRERPSRPHEVCLTYVTARGPWYDVSWKGLDDRSGGLITNIGSHFFDLLLWLFGWRGHRFWIVLATTVSAGIVGLAT